jgi:hypothetical protein
MRRKAFPGQGRSPRGTVPSSAITGLANWVLTPTGTIVDAGSEGVEDGAEFSFTSSSSNTNSKTYSWFGGLNGYIDSGTAGVDADPPANWSLAGNYDPRFDTAQTLCRSKSLGFVGAYHDTENPGNGASFGWGYDTGGSIVEILVRYFVYYGCNDDITALQWKLFKLMPTSSVVDTNPQVNYSHWYSDDQFSITDATGHFGSNNPGVFFAGFAGFPNSMPQFNDEDDEWYSLEFWYRPATDTTAANGATTLKMWRVTDGTQVMDLNLSSIDDYDTAGRYRYFVWQNYFGNANPDNGTGAQPTSGGGYAYHDDFWLQHGSGARQMILLGDASTYAACNQGLMAIQPWSVWTGTGRTITVNKGPHANLTGKYLYEIATDGTVVNSNGIPLE